MAQKLKRQLTTEMIEALKAANEHVKLQAFVLATEDGDEIGTVFMKRPTAFVIGQVEKYIEKESFKAREILIKGTVADKEQLDEIMAFEKNSDEYAAVFSAASQMLPVGKATAKKL